MIYNNLQISNVKSKLVMKNINKIILRFCDSETIKAIFEFVRCTVFEIFEVKDHSWALFKINYLKNYNDLNFETYEMDR
ncbi:hypothetical protein BLOT_014173 [Blomia tropicalis]|nr:hypothetical protein BLOT_014173 [Blomia tropicalis]